MSADEDTVLPEISAVDEDVELARLAYRRAADWAASAPGTPYGSGISVRTEEEERRGKRG